MKFLIIIFLAVTVAAAIEETLNFTDRIVNGKTAFQGQFPYQVGLLLFKTDPTLCGGSLISATWVLTAAHCTDGASNVQVFLGGIDWNKPDATLYANASNIIQHENYEAGKVTADIALIKIKRVKFTKFVQKIDLPKETPSEPQYINETVTITGWGVTEDGIEPTMPILQYAAMTVISNDECEQTFLDKQNNIMPKKICAKPLNDTSACHGDSGGPMVLKDSKILIGVTSYIFRGECDKGHPTVFTRVTSYLDWIADRTGVQY